METTKYLSKYPSIHEGLAALSSELGIKVKEYPEQDIIVLNYCQIESPKTHPITRECRSLVINYSGEVISRSFDRFFNLGEGECEVNFNSAVAFEKADGSLINLYYVHSSKEWAFRTRGTAFAESQLPSRRTYQEAILECIGLSFESFQEAMSGVDKTITFIFEFVSPENRIVTRYTEPQLILLGARSVSGIYPQELNSSIYGERLDFAASIFTDELKFKNVRAAKYMKVNSTEQVEKAVAALQNLEEGFVVLDYVNQTRVKVKSPAYLICHRIRGEGFTPNRIAELVSIAEEEEYLSYYPEDRQYFQSYIDARDLLLAEAEDVFYRENVRQDQREFALAVKDYPFSSLLFTARKKRCTIMHAWAESKESYRAELIKKVVDGKTEK